MAEDDEIIDVEDHTKLSEVKLTDSYLRPKIKDIYTRVETFDEINEEETLENKVVNIDKKLPSINSCITNFKENHRLGETIALYPDKYGNPKIIIGPDCM